MFFTQGGLAEALLILRSYFHVWSYTFSACRAMAVKSLLPGVDPINVWKSSSTGRHQVLDLIGELSSQPSSGIFDNSVDFD